MTNYFTHRMLLMALLAGPLCFSAETDKGRNRLAKEVRRVGISNRLMDSH